MCLDTVIGSTASLYNFADIYYHQKLIMILNIKQETTKKDENQLSSKRLKIQVNFPYLLLQLHFQDYVI